MEERVLLQSNCTLYRLSTREELDTFSCGDADLDDFFHQEACLYDGQLLGKTYFLATKISGEDEIDGIGSQAIEYVASWFVHPDNKTGCRFIVVDAYNKESVLHFYGKNGFKFLYSSEELEKDANHIPTDEHLESRMMYLDLLGYIR